MPATRSQPGRKVGGSRPGAARRSLRDRTPLAEWTAAAIGAVLTLGVVSYSLGEIATSRPGPPALRVEAEPSRAVAGSHVVPLVVRNDSHATAAEVEVRGVLEQAGAPIEERTAVFAYVPGGGEARGGLVFEHDPAGLDLRVSAMGYEEP